MKRAGKCVNKKAYTFHKAAEDVSIRAFKKWGVYTKVYECPTCLDFHLSSKRVDSQTRLKLDISTGKARKASTLQANKRKKRSRVAWRVVHKLLVDVFSNPQPKSLWTLILGIIKVSRI